MYDLKKLEDCMARYDGYHSLFYIDQNKKILEFMDKCKMREEEKAFFPEFMFFEDDYYLIRKDMILRGNQDAVIDIGCQFGFQSELFLDGGYTGIDYESFSAQFNYDRENVTYVTDVFPTDKVDITGKTVISHMSLSYFNHVLGDSEKEIDLIHDRLLSQLRKCRVLYFRGTPAFTDKLKTVFDSATQLSNVEDEMLRRVSTGTWRFENHKSI